MGTDERSDREAWVVQALDDLDIEHSVEHHRPVYTVEESKSVRSLTKGAHLKNLFLCDRKKRRFLLLIAVEHKRVALKELSRILEIQSGLRFANEAHLQEYLGVTSGAVSPFALLYDPDHRVEVVFDRSICDHEWVNAHPLHNEATITLSSKGLYRFLDAQGHQVHHADFEDGREVQ